MAEKTLGKWANPPLAYVAAEVGISPHYSTAQFMPSIQQSLREVYPRTIEGAELTLDLAGSNTSPIPQPVWQLLMADSGRGVRIGARGIALHATHYPDFPTFAEWMAQVLQAVEESGLNPFVERVGLRYIDYILPSEDHQPADYLAAALRGVAPPGAGPAQTSMWIASFPFDGCTVSARVAAPAPLLGNTVLPPNFSALPLAKPKPMIQAEERSKQGLAYGFIDTDCTQTISQPFNAQVLASKFATMHDYVSVTFKTFMSDLAVKEWVK